MPLLPVLLLLLLLPFVSLCPSFVIGRTCGTSGASPLLLHQYLHQPGLCPAASWCVMWDQLINQNGRICAAIGYWVRLGLALVCGRSECCLWRSGAPETAAAEHQVNGVPDTTSYFLGLHSCQNSYNVTCVGCAVAGCGCPAPQR